MQRETDSRRVRDLGWDVCPRACSDSGQRPISYSLWSSLWKHVKRSQFCLHEISEMFIGLRNKLSLSCSDEGGVERGEVGCLRSGEQRAGRNGGGEDS